MQPFSSTRSLVTVLYIGTDFTPEHRHNMLTRRIGVTVAENAARAERLLSHFRVAAVIFATPDLQDLQRLIGRGTPIIVLAGSHAACDVDGVTIMRRDSGLEDLAAIIYGVARAGPQSKRDAA